MTTHETDLPPEFTSDDDEDLDERDTLAADEDESDATWSPDENDVEDEEPELLETDEADAEDEAEAEADVEYDVETDDEDDVEADVDDDIEAEVDEPEIQDEGVEAEADDEDDESVLLTESAPGSVLPPEEQPDEPAAGLERLEPVGPDRPVDPGTGGYQERWTAIQTGFIDDPHRAVESASALMAEMWGEIERSIADEREVVEGRWQSSERSTDDLRAAMQDYRGLYARLTSFTST
jgi:hypothetical protein